MIEFSEALQDIKNGLSKGELITLFCECSVSYSGRAESELETGERLVVIKQDRSVMVHQPTGSTPINYMKPDSSVSPSIVDDELVIDTRNLSDKDYLSIHISKVYSLVKRRLHDGASLELVGTEKDMSNMIRENPGEIGEWFTAVSREEHTEFGFIDVYGHDEEGNLVIVECKRYTAGVSAVQQLRRYVEKVASLKGIGPSKVRGVLAAPSLARNAEGMIEEWGYEFVHVSPPKRHRKFKKSQRSLDDF